MKHVIIGEAFLFWAPLDCSTHGKSAPIAINCVASRLVTPTKLRLHRQLRSSP
jgi:hypothetical protein